MAGEDEDADPVEPDAPIDEPGADGAAAAEPVGDDMPAIENAWWLYSRRISMRRITILLVVGAAACAFALLPLAASGQPASRLYVGMNLHFTGPSSSAGTFLFSGALADSGTADVQHLAVVPLRDRDAGRLSGDETFTGAQGALHTHFEGVAFPLSSPHQVGRGRFEVVSGTGAYAALRGHGEFLIVVDAVSNQLDGTERGTVSP